MPGRINFGLAIYSGNTFPAAQSILLLEPAQEQLALYLVILRGRTESTGFVSRSKTGNKCSVVGKCSNDGGPQAGIRYGRRPGNRVQAGQSKKRRSMLSGFQHYIQDKGPCCS